ncbi:CDC73-domain-containing protein [Tothia fuscella]|uniref:CDC73-domain-containing protein n=1 Tax=Tothia fuscella TaxID=1048955 RepID=A0A9P4NJR1_9PEZI|nr:CDC73-domain-containing protein [Tothia fuscella]
MASSEAELTDPLLCLRTAIATNHEPLLTSTPDPSSADDAEPNLAKATHIHFNADSGHQTFPLTTDTRFSSSASNESVSFRTVYFAWLHKDDNHPVYISAAQRLNDELQQDGSAGGRIQNLPFTERMGLISFLDGSTEDTENIRPLDAQEASEQAAGSAAIASGSAGGIAPVLSAGGARAPGTVDPRLAEIYAGERKMADRNSILRGIKPTDFSHVRKQAEIFLRNSRSKTSSHAQVSNNSALVSNLKKPSGRRLEPIILLSPSASSLLRMSNIKDFLEGGFFHPADSASAGSSNTANILHTQRTMASIDSKPLRFILVDTPDQFKPDYWQRVVAVFTTGQAWQFKSYKWQTAPELFAHALGIYIGWTNEALPETVKGWGRSVKVVAVDKWSPNQGEKARWRDRAIVEEIWTAIEESMRARNWGKEGFTG